MVSWSLNLECTTAGVTIKSVDGPAFERVVAGLFRASVNLRKREVKESIC